VPWRVRFAAQGLTLDQVGRTNHIDVSGRETPPSAASAGSHSPKCLKPWASNMSRQSPFGHPFLVGFDEIEQALDRVAKAASDGYPPYNIERLARANNVPERLRITLAVAGFSRDQLEVILEENQLVIRGRQIDDKSRHFLHRGIAARQFQRAFLLAEGMEVLGADLSNGLLSIDLARPEAERIVRRINIVTTDEA
jgi:HSP20 family molecular chaperone IbpA